MKVNKAVILCGGNGTRFLPYTKAVPKEMLAVVDKPALQLLVEEAVSAGITDILVVTSPHKQVMERYFEHDGNLLTTLYQSGKILQAKTLENITNLANVSFVYQTTANGTASAVQLAKNFVGNESFAVLSGDDVFYNKGNSPTGQVISAYRACGGSAVVGVQKVRKSTICKYASCVLDGKCLSKNDIRVHKISALAEKPLPKYAPSLLAPLGRYVFESSIFYAIDKIGFHTNGEKYLPDAINVVASKSNVFACELVGTYYDFGDKFGYASAVADYALRSSFGRQYRKYLLRALLKKQK